MMKTFRQTTAINAPAGVAFAWHEQPDAFMRLAPPWENLTLVSRTGGLRDGGRLVFTINKGPVRVRWVAEHYDYVEGRQFCDRAVAGPFPHWQHRHLFQPTGEGSCEIIDEVEYRPPLGALGEHLPACLLADKIAGMFAYRAAISREDIERHHAAALAPRRVLIAGSSGFVGRRLVPFLTTGGHQVTRLLRGAGGAPAQGGGVATWNPATGFDDRQVAALEGTDVVINLAGESIMGLWTAAKMRRIRESRVESTRRLCEGLARMERKPELLISASAVGIYGERGDTELDEGSPLGNGFLADVGREWEAATQPAEQAGIRVVHLRIGVVLGPDGGALGAMLPAAMAGLAGPLGNGRHQMSWITREDLIHLVHHIMATPGLRGPVNATAPNPVSNREFMAVLGRVLGRPTVLAVPGFVLRAAAGQLATDVLLHSARVMPRAALGSGFKYALPDLEGALRLITGRGTIKG